MHVIGDVSNEIDQLDRLMESSQALNLLLPMDLPGWTTFYLPILSGTK